MESPGRTREIYEKLTKVSDLCVHVLPLTVLRSAYSFILNTLQLLQESVSDDLDYSHLVLK